MNEQDRAMTIKEVAEFLNISTQMVYNLVKDGSLKAFKIGSASRIMHSDLQEFIFQQKAAFAKDHVASVPEDSHFSVDHLCLRKGSFQIEDISFSIPKGKILSILGPSGSGKTLLLKAIAGIHPLENGTIFFGKTQMDGLPPGHRKIGYVFEDYALFPHLTGKKNISFPLNVKKKKKEYIEAETQKRADELNIDAGYLKILPDIMPEGIKQLVAIARGKNHDFDLFIMDEPMAQLDASLHVKMRMFLQKMVRELERTTLIAFNDPEDALALSDYIAVIDEGRLLQFSEAWEVYHHPVNLLVMEMVSRFGVNALNVEINQGHPEPYRFPVDEKDGIYTMAFRPEEVRLAENDGIPATIDSAQFLTPRRKIAACHLDDSVNVQLMLPASAEGEIRFLPTKPLFFPVEE
jgi:excisionase family DNA binding protein